MMMAQKRLDELLKEDQEPFLLKKYIADRRTQLRPAAQTQLQLKKRKPISETSNVPGKFCKNACFYSFHDSPDLRKSPLFDFASPAAKSPCRSPKNAIFLHIPTRTTALLLEAALRIQKQSSKSKTQNKNLGFGLFGSILKRLKNRNRSRKREIEADKGNNKVSVKDILRWDSSVGRSKFSDQKENFQLVVDRKSGCSCNGSTPSSAVWSESNDEEKSLELETSSSSQSEDSHEIFVCNDIENGDCAYCDSPFRFVLQRSPSSGRRTPEFPSPAASPRRNKTEGNEKYDVESLKKLQAGGEEEEEDKEQCSPVSVLDAPFEDDDDDGHDNEDDDDDNEGYDIEGSYTIVQRAKHQLLQKLRRFEKLAELDPIELEKRILEHENDEDVDDLEDQEYECEYEDLCKTSFHQDWQISKDMKLLVSDLIAEEEKQQIGLDEDQEVMKRVLKRLESWKDVESNTIDMMVEQDFRREFDGWNRNQEQVGEAAAEIELAIFGLLVEELSEELVC